MIIICADTIREAERQIETIKNAARSGQMMGMGASSMEDLIKGLRAVESQLPDGISLKDLL